VRLSSLNSQVPLGRRAPARCSERCDCRVPGASIRRRLGGRSIRGPVGCGLLWLLVADVDLVSESSSCVDMRAMP
jgi:hypothetical protein